MFSGKLSSLKHDAFLFVLLENARPDGTFRNFRVFQTAD